MNHTDAETIRRILIVDDNQAIHADLRKILIGEEGTADIDGDEADLFGATDAPPVAKVFEIDSAYQGQEALTKVQQALEAGRPYAMAFVDVRMPPGWDGIETVARLWPVDPNLQVVICTAYSDYSWGDMIEKLGVSDRLLILKKPFDNIEAMQFATSLCEKHRVTRKAGLKLYEVERIVERRTRELRESHVSLAAARDEAETANHAKTDFLANMSHEIRTPMTAILGFADVLQDAVQAYNAPPECASAIETIQRNGQYLLAIIDDILDISKIDAGKMTVERIACSPRQLVDEVVALVRVRAESKKLALVPEYVGAVPDAIHTDPTRLRQILINLIGNAIKFTSEGSVRVVVQAVGDQDKDDVLQFDVIDTGIGMTVEQSAHLFQPFHQADTSTTRQFGGTGLGLHLSRRLAEMLGGDVAIAETQPGIGTRFRVTVAMGLPENAPTGEDRTRTGSTKKGNASDAPAHRGLSGLRILLAEDAEDNQRLISFVLNKAGADVTVADNGRIAVDAALAAREADEPFDVILMDMQMPVMDGYAATACLRSEGYAGPIIALTAHAMSSDRDKCLQAGCDDYAKKPIDRPALIGSVAKWARDHSTAVKPAMVATPRD